MEKARKKTYFVTVLLGAALVACLIYYGSNRGAVSPGFTLDYGFGSAYTHEEIDAAAKAAVRDFKRNYPSCTLNSLRCGAEQNQWAQEQFGADQGLMLYGSYTTGDKGTANFLPHKTCSDWGWLLVREDGGAWRVGTAGLG